MIMTDVIKSRYVTIQLSKLIDTLDFYLKKNMFSPHVKRGYKHISEGQLFMKFQDTKFIWICYLIYVRIHVFDHFVLFF